MLFIDSKFPGVAVLGQGIWRKRQPWLLAVVFEVFLRQHCLLRLTFPEDTDDPPSLTVVHQLDAIDSTLKRLRVFLLMARFVGAKGLRDVPVLLCAACYFSLEESVLFKELAATGNIIIRGEGTRTILFLACQRSVGSTAGRSARTRRNQPRARCEKRAKSIPIAFLACRSGDDIIQSGDDAID